MIPEKAIRGFFKSHQPSIDDSDLPRRAEVALVLDVSLDNNNPNILFIQFEDFVLKNKYFLDKLCNHMSISSNISSNYQPDLSKKNIGKFHQLLSKNELQTIESNLGEYIYGAK